MNRTRSKSRQPFNVWLMAFVSHEPSSSVDAALKRYIQEHDLAIRESLDEPPQITDIRTRLAILEESGLLDPANLHDPDVRRYADSMRSSLVMYSHMSPGARALLANEPSKEAPLGAKPFFEWVDSVFRHAMNRTETLHPVMGVPLWWLCWLLSLGFYIAAFIAFLAAMVLCGLCFIIAVDWLFHKLF